MIDKIKILTTAMIIICTSFSLQAEKSALVTADPFPGERPGQYVYYHDMRTGVYGSKEPVNRLVGIMKADNKQYIIRILNVKDGKSFLYLGHYFLNKGIMEFTSDSMQGDLKEGTFLLADILNLMNYLGSETVKIAPEIVNKKDLSVSSTWVSYNRKFINSYKWWIPFYKLESCINSESDAFGEKGYTSLKLVCFGTVAPDDPDMFTRISRLPVYYTKKISDKQYIIPAAEKMKVKIDNTAVSLDKNWHFAKGDPAKGTQDSYWLKKITERDAQIGIESIESGNLKLDKNEIEAFVRSLQYQSCVISDTVNINLTLKTLSLSLWDADNGVSTYTEYISLGVKNNLLTVLSFSAFDFIYYANTDYFRSILNTDFNN